MAANQFLCPKIDVLHWDAVNVTVKCPYCEESHRHEVNLSACLRSHSDMKSNFQRVSHCFPGGQYEFIFPIDESRELVGYEIDKRRACFVNSSLRTDRTDDNLYSPERDEYELADSFRSKMKILATDPKSKTVLNLHDDAREVETINLSDHGTLKRKKILFALSECVLGNLGAISQYLKTSSDVKVFLHGKDETGDTTLIKAAREKSHEMVSLLLQNGADFDDINHDGRSALMEAALWGRLRNVKALLNSNADKSLRDNRGRCAMDLAQPTRRNEDERYNRSSFAAAESVRERDRDRRHIVILLSDSNAEKRHAYTIPLSRTERNNYCFRKSPSEMAIILNGPIERYRVPRINKTAAVLDRGRQFARISATSGWGTDSLPLNNEIRPSWIEQVYYIASTIGHRFQDAPDPGWDQGKLGQYFACHAEKKLIAYFLDKHVFMPKDREPDQTLEHSIFEVEDTLEEGFHSSIAWAKVCKLEERKIKLDRQLFDADDRLLGELYDEQKIKRLKDEIRAIDGELSSLESDAFVATMRTQQKRRLELWKKEEEHQDLMELSRNEPPISLKCAVVLSSNKICEDCDMFREKVNAYFQLNIEMDWCI